MNKTVSLRQNPTLSPGLSRLGLLEYRLCVAINQTSRRRLVHGLFKAVSRLGDGVFWYVLMATLALLQGAGGRLAALQMALTAGLGLLIYRQLKSRLLRERPFIRYADIRCGCAPLDQYSFPSGHTLQAVLMSTVALAWFPGLAWVLLPFTLLVALSRVVLGLHYPSDVVCGALLGWTLAQASLWVFAPF